MPEPIIQKLPETQRAVENKYRRNPDLLSTAPTPISNALLALDIQRSQRGQNPLSARQSRLALQAAMTGEATTPEPDRSFFGSLTADLGTILQSIPRLPVALYREINALQDAPAALSKALAEGKNPLDTISRIAQAPGVRLLPGSYVAGNLGNPGELAKHPLFTLLDVLPAKQLKVGGRTLGNRAITPVKQVTAKPLKALGATAPGEWAKEAFGTVARDVAQLEAKFSSAMREAAYGKGTVTDPLTKLVREAGTLRHKYPAISEARRMELTRLMSEDDLGIGNLSGEELAFVNDTRRITDELGQYGVSQGLLQEIDGELFDLDTAARILRARRRGAIASDYGDVRESIVNPEKLLGEYTNRLGVRMYAPDIEVFDMPPIPEGMVRLFRHSRGGKRTGHFSIGKPLSGYGDERYYIDMTPEEVAKLPKGEHDAKIVTDEFGGRVKKPSYKPLERVVTDTIKDRIADVTKKEYLKAGGKIKLIEGYAHALQNAGIDARPIFDKLRDYRNTKSASKYSDAEFAEWWDQTKSTLQPARQVDLESYIEQLKNHAKTDPLAARILDHVKAGRFQEAQVLAKQASRRKVYGIPNMDDLVYALDAPKLRDRYFNSIRKWDPTTVARRQRSAKLIEDRAAPARFQPRINELTKRAVREVGSAKLINDPDWDNIFKALEEGNFGWLSRHGHIPKEEILQIQNDIRSTWKDMKAAGHDPVFVHRISENQLGSIRYPRVLERIPRPTQVNKRSWNLTPAIDDVSVALTHQGLEWLARRGSEEFIDTVLQQWGRTQGDLIDQYLPAARIAAKGSEDVLHVAERLMKKEWQKYNPEGVINWPSSRIKRWSDQETWVPKTVANTVQRMHVPPAGRLSAISDPIMNVFRTSLLPLSPRWHVYNMIGGGLLLTVGTGPKTWRQLSKAMKMVRAGNIPDDIPRGIGTVPRDVLEWSSKGSIQRPLEQLFHYKGGQTLRRLYEETRKARTGFQKVIDASYDFNAFFDDMYRTMAYLEGKDKAITKGMTQEAATKAGVELARKTFQQWDRMTPLERSIMRFVFPFYGWTSHITKFVLQYPVDHPIRTSIMSSFARNELNDLGTGLPDRFLNMFFLGDMDEEGNVTGFNLAGMNPFSDVHNNFTFQGFLGQTNPLISTAFQSAGVDLQNGGPELFPNLAYDHETGRLTFRGRNPLMILGESIFPQSRVLMGFADSSSEFQQLLRTNPDAAGRLLLSQAGIPIIFRNVNVPQEIAKAEVARDEAQSKVLNQALKSGNWNEAQKYPMLRPLLTQLAQLQGSDQLQPFTPESAGQSAIRRAQEALGMQLKSIPGIGG